MSKNNDCFVLFWLYLNINIYNTLPTANNLNIILQKLQNPICLYVLLILYQVHTLCLHTM